VLYRPTNVLSYGMLQVKKMLISTVVAEEEDLLGCAVRTGSIELWQAVCREVGESIAVFECLMRASVGGLMRISREVLRDLLVNEEANFEGTHANIFARTFGGIFYPRVTKNDTFD